MLRDGEGWPPAGLRRRRPRRVLRRRHRGLLRPPAAARRAQARALRGAARLLPAGPGGAGAPAGGGRSPRLICRGMELLLPRSAHRIPRCGVDNAAALRRGGQPGRRRRARPDLSGLDGRRPRRCTRVGSSAGWRHRRDGGRRSSSTPALGDAGEGENPLVWLEDGAERALAVLGDADPDDPVWNWVDDAPGPGPVLVPALAHEMVIHRADAEAAAGTREPRWSRPSWRRTGSTSSSHFLPIRARTDQRGQLGGQLPLPHHRRRRGVGRRLRRRGVTVRREHAKADVAVRGPPSDLELFLYNRRGSDGLEVFGDEAKVAWSEAGPVLTAGRLGAPWISTTRSCGSCSSPWAAPVRRQPLGAGAPPGPEPSA